jgi:penicillin-binding protein A
VSWRDYQRRLEASNRRKFKLRAMVSGLLGLAALGGVVYFLLGAFWVTDNDFLPVNACPPPAVAQDDPKAILRGLITPEMLVDAPKELKVKKGDADWTLQLSLNPALQNFIQEKLERYKVDWAGVAVLDPKTGEVLALAYHSEKNPAIDDLALRATFPAASVFKIVTSAAALEEGGYHPDSKVAFCGNMYGVKRRQLLRDSGPNAMTLRKAFAKSANAVFGKIAAHDLNGLLLDDYASRFGFNTEIPFEVPLDQSVADIPKGDVLDEARTAAGFGKVTLSPLHGALMAAAVLNDGQMMEPYLVEKAVDAAGKVQFEGNPRVWLNPISADTAQEMRRMMATTVTEGTAHRSFRRLSRDPVLSQLQMGGKTGSLTGTNPPGKTEWFVGYARSNDAQIAVGIVVVNDKYWRVKPAELAKEIFAHGFGPAPILEASADKALPRRM